MPCLVPFFRFKEFCFYPKWILDCWDEMTSLRNLTDRRLMCVSRPPEAHRGQALENFSTACAMTSRGSAIPVTARRTQAWHPTPVVHRHTNAVFLTGACGRAQSGCRAIPSPLLAGDVEEVSEQREMRDDRLGSDTLAFFVLDSVGHVLAPDPGHGAAGQIRLAPSRTRLLPPRPAPRPWCRRCEPVLEIHGGGYAPARRACR